MSVWALLRRVRVPWWAALSGATFFIVVPSNVATAVYVAERTDAMVAIAVCLGMLSLYRFHRTGAVRWLVWMNVAYIVGLLAKEEATAIVPFAIVFWLYLRWERTPPDGPETGIVAHWGHEAASRVASFGRSRGSGATGCASWHRLLAVTAAYLAYRGLVMPADTFANRLAETQNPVKALLSGLRQRGQGGALADPGPARVSRSSPRSSSASWSVRGLGRGGSCCSVSGSRSAGVLARCRSAAASNRGCSTSPRSAWLRPWRGSWRSTPRRSSALEIRAATSGAIAAVAVLVGAFVVAALGVSQVKSQNIYQPGGSFALETNMLIWENKEALARVPEENVQRIRQILLDAGLIDEDGRFIDDPTPGD